MPRLDVSDVLTDSNFCDATLRCERYNISINPQGRSVTVQTLLGFAGVITSDSGERLNRGIIGEHATDTITVITRFRLRDAGSGATADIVQWNGNRYTVVSVNDYSTYGVGFTENICEMVPLAG